jgi:hypothetical protein
MAGKDRELRKQFVQVSALATELVGAGNLK